MSPIHDEWVLRAAPIGGGFVPPLPEPLRSILLRRVVRPEAREGAGGPPVLTEADYRVFSAPSVVDLHDGSLIAGMSDACARILDAVRKRERILIYGDYDVDGVTSIVLLQTVLKTIGADVGFVVPHRQVDGYGLKIEVLERVLAESDVRLVITVDCGISSVEPVRLALERGIDVIVTDHHLPPGFLPDAIAVLNPKKAGCEYPFDELAGVGVAFKLAVSLLERSARSMSIASLLKIAAIGTVADVAPLIGENRTITKLGLDGLSDPRNPGLRALLRQLGLIGRPVKSSDVGFKIGPRINAAGRLASADTAIQLFAARSESDAFPIVMELERLNGERRRIEKLVLAEAEAQVDPTNVPNILIAAGHGWHKGVLGLCAARLMQKYHRPALVMTEHDGVFVGSGRSIPGINLHGQLDRIRDEFTSFGGHEAACGFSFPAERLDSLRAKLIGAFREFDEAAFVCRLSIEGTLFAGQIDSAFFKAHQSLEPFGAGNPQPVFLLEGAECVGAKEFSEDCFEVRLKDGTGEIRAVVWPSEKSLIPLIRGGSRVSVAAKVEEDRYHPSGVRLVVVDAANATGAPLEREGRNESASTSVHG